LERVEAIIERLARAAELPIGLQVSPPSGTATCRFGSQVIDFPICFYRLIDLTVGRCSQKFHQAGYDPRPDRADRL